MAERRPNVSTISPGAPFVDALAAGVLARHGAAPLDLARVVLLLPTRRACLALRDAFLRQSEGAALLLPRIAPLGDIDPDEIEPDAEGLLADDADAPPAVSDLARRMLLARLIAEWPGSSAFSRVEQAARLAAELARLIDQVQTERLSFDTLGDLVPEDYATHWQETLEFLAIVTRHWPEILAERGLIDPAARRNLMIEALAARWRARPPAGPVIAAGSTGSIPATAELLAVIARLPAGEVVLPGLDREADDATWEAIDASHPQYGLKRLLDRLEIDRDRVGDWFVTGLTATHPGRARLLSIALRPAGTTDSWRDEPPPPAAAFTGLERIDCPGPQEEAGVIALRLREALEHDGRTAALVTRDRKLARRVAAELRRWGIGVDDSAGQPLADTAPGSFLRLGAAMVAEKAAPLALLAALKHPLAAGGVRAGVFRARVRELERRVLRGPRPDQGFGGIARVLDETKAPAALRRWFSGLAAAADAFATLIAAPDARLAALVRAHLGFAEWLAATDREPGASRLWSGEAGEAAAAFFADLVEDAQTLPPFAGRAYPALLDSLLEGRVARPRHGRHPRLHIWGPLEARLQRADLMILGGLNEGSWPPEAPADPWLSRPMRARFGLPPPERRIGLAAHDFVQCASAGQVVLTRAEKVDGTPTVPSRWLARLDNLLAGWRRAGRIVPRTPWREWQLALDRPDAVVPCAPPAPKPPLAARPRRLSVTAIETWQRDPYAIYARRILGLKPLDPIDADPGAAERGSIIHDALDSFVRAHPGRLPDDALDRLLACGETAFGGALDRPGVRAFWWPRFVRIARWFVETERQRRDGLAGLWTEVEGERAFEGPGGTFVLTAKADRIERDTGDCLAIIDYKTGTLPSKGDIEQGYSPQLPLEAAIAAAGGFAGVPAGGIATLSYWRLTGGEPAGKECPLTLDAMASAENAAARLEALIAAFDDPATPYHALPDPAKAPRFNDYDHLARVREWADIGDEGEP
ncbi:MAG: double-strand break repair protein AddB [Alphaproteobacteria bacterium]